MKSYDILFQKYWNAPSQCFSEKQPLYFPGDWKVEQLEYMQDFLHTLHKEVDVQVPGFTEAEWKIYPKISAESYVQSSQASIKRML